MNGLLFFALTALAAAIGCLIWAMAERARAGRAEVELDLLRHGGEGLKHQAAFTANAVAEELVKRATETFTAQEALAQAKLEAQLKPVAETLAKFEAKVAAADEARAREGGALKAQIDQLLAASTATQEEARRLSAALRRGAGVQGRWGEQMLRNVLEMAGMTSPHDFVEQLHVAVEGGAVRPDVTVRLPGGGVFVIDAKCSLTAYLEALEATDEVVREAALARHAASVKAHMQGLAGKAYWDQLETSPDFVAMFIPGDAFLSAASERLPDLYTQAMERRVILTTPSSLFALCKAVVYGWRVEQQHINAREIASLGRDLYKRLAVMGAHVAGVGKALGAAVNKYNEFVGSLETQVLSQARRFEGLKVDHQGAEIRELAPIEAAPRPLVKLAVDNPAEQPTLTLGEAAPTSAP
ncbi:MAG TPA: DNA recombination protein RmuC [Caulobacteraceae bacterium]|jgi:DNA recombination protein RmuC|nr:DNA recombination protein RmuC [Caulobacteraceae bacterium]